MAENRANNTGQNNNNNNNNMQNIIHRDAWRRMEQMQQKVPYRRQRNMQSFYRNNNSAYQNTAKSKQTEEPVNDTSKESSGHENFKMPFGALNGLEKLDTDKILIMALLAMIYKDGGNKKLMMALAYLLT